MRELYIESVTNYTTPQKTSLLKQYQDKIELTNKKIRFCNKLLIAVSIFMLVLHFI